MIDELKKSVVVMFGKLCRKHKVKNYNREVFMSNTIEIMDSLSKEIDDLKKDVKSLKEDLENKKNK